LQRLGNIASNLNGGTIRKSFTIEDWEMLSKMIFQWPDANKFPGIDLLRLIVLHSPAPLAFQTDLLSRLLPILTCVMHNKSQETIAMLIIRVYCNAFAQNEYCIRQFSAYGHNKNLQTALANLLLK
jgi:hypothetical protein